MPTVNVGDTIEYYAPESVVGDDNGANLCRILERFSDIKERATEEYIESNKSRKMVNATVYFIILLSLNLSFHI